MLDTTLTSGVFKFSQRITPEMLIGFVRTTWASDPAFLALAVRGCDGERKQGISFTYRHDGTEASFDEFLDRCIGRLRRVFHSDFIGWDISSSTHVIKHEQVPPTAATVQAQHEGRDSHWP
jgi:hypothetical protein